MTRRIFRRTRLVSAIRSCLNPASATALTVGLALASAGPAWAAMENGAPGKAALRPENVATRDEILFIDAHVADPRKLLVGVKQGVETVILEDGRSAIEQITEILETRNPSAVHLVAHGEAGRLQLGDTWLDAKQLDANMALIRRWFAGADGITRPDLLLYACNLAQGSEGVAFVEKLAELSGADVAASSDITGAENKGGDWDLEVITGEIETELAFSEITVNEYKSILGDLPVTFTVTKTADTDDGTCGVDCSLREAVEDANDEAGDDYVVFAGGVTGTIDIGSFGYGQIRVDDVEEYGLTITGPGPGAMTIDAVDESRHFYVADGLVLSGLTLTEGRDSENGGSIYGNHSGSELVIEDCVLTSNYAGEDGGAISDTEGDITIRDSVISDNFAENDGGGIYFYMEGDDDLMVVDSVITDNTAGEDGGGIAAYSEEDGGTVYVIRSTISDNTAGSDGGGIWFYTDDDGYVVIEDSTISGNVAGGDGGGIAFGSDHDMVMTNSTVSGNTAESRGGGIYFDSGEMYIYHSTIVLNVADFGGGIYQCCDASLDHTIVTNNTARVAGDDIFGSGTDTDASFSLIGDTSGTTVINQGGTYFISDAMLGPLADNGGPTLTHLPGAMSFAVGRGDFFFSPSPVYDQRGPGFPREILTIDIGAVESPFERFVPIIPTLSKWSLALLALILPASALLWLRRRRRTEKG